MRTALSVLAVIGVCSLAAIAAARSPSGERALLADISAHLAAPPVLRADFRQEKRLKALSRPLVSRGRLIFAAGKGISWRVDEPYAMQILLTPDRVVERRDGATRGIDTTPNPFYQLLSQAFLALMAGDITPLEAQFAAKPVSVAVGWSVDLVPRDPALAGAIASINLRGDRFVDEVRVREARGDETIVTFSGFRAEPAELTAAEAEDFVK